MKKSNIYDDLLEYDSKLRFYLERAITRSVKGHRKKREVKKFLREKETLIPDILEKIKSGKYIEDLHYRKLTKTNVSNGKVRKIDSPNFYTRLYQHFFLELIEPIYYSKDPGSGLNCKSKHGITSKNKKYSVVKRIKHCFYDLHQYNYYLKIDQRRCYEHITRKIVRKSLKNLITSKWLIDFGINVSFSTDSNKLPIGTPTSPLLHHIVMLQLLLAYYVIPQQQYHYRTIELDENQYLQLLLNHYSFQVMF